MLNVKWASHGSTVPFLEVESPLEKGKYALYGVYYKMPNAPEGGAVVIGGPDRTHVLVALIWSPTTYLYMAMQSECWSPSGEARDVIRETGLSHTSMSVGDVVCDMQANEYFVVEWDGWTRVYPV